MSYVYIALTILFTVYGQMILKWQIGRLGGVPPELAAKFLFFAKAFIDPWLMSGLISAYFASLCWMSAVSKLNLSHAYPFMSFAFVLVMFLSAFIFHEPLTWPKVVGMVCIVAGIVISSQG
jgi:multidrug transporter EmrE-like cation transporter